MGARETCFDIPKLLSRHVSLYDINSIWLVVGKAPCHLSGLIMIFPKLSSKSFQCGHPVFKTDIKAQLKHMAKKQMAKKQVVQFFKGFTLVFER